MINVILGAGTGGYIAGIVIEVLVIVAALVFIFLTLSGKIGKKPVAVEEDSEWADEPDQEEFVEDEEAAEEDEPMLAEEAPVVEKKSKKKGKKDEESEEDEDEPRKPAKKRKGAEAEDEEEEVAEEPKKAVKEPKEPTKRKIKIRLNIRSTDGSEILSTDVEPTETGEANTEEAKIDVNVDEISKAIEGNAEAETPAEEPIAEEQAEEEAPKKRFRRGKK